MYLIVYNIHLKALNALIFVVYPKEVAHDSYDLKSLEIFIVKNWFPTKYACPIFSSTRLVLIFFVKKDFVESSNNSLCSSKQSSAVIPVESSSTMRQLSIIYKIYDKHKTLFV